MEMKTYKIKIQINMKIQQRKVNRNIGIKSE